MQFLNNSNGRRGFMKAAAIAVTALFQLSTGADACSCLPGEYCDATSLADVIVSGPILASETSVTSSSTYGVITYTVNAVRFYKQDTDFVLGQVLKFTTATSSAACGLEDLQIGVEYVIGMNTDAEGNLSANLCGPSREFALLTGEEIAVLENGGTCDTTTDPCADLGCSEYQECVVYDEEATCGDTCAEGTCPPTEICELVPVVCVTTPCNFPPVAYCVYDSDGSMSFSYDYVDVDDFFF